MAKQAHFPFVRIQGNALAVYEMVTVLLQRAEVDSQEMFYWHSWYCQSCRNASNPPNHALDLGLVKYGADKWKLVDNDTEKPYTLIRWRMDI